MFSAFRGSNRDLDRRLRAVEEHLSALQKHHEALRGRFYQAVGQGGDPPADAPQALSKAEVLRRFGPKQWAPTNRRT